MTNTMAFAISTPATSLLHSSSSSTKSSSICAVANSAVCIPKNAIFQHVKYVPQLGFTQWNGLKQLGIRITQYSVNKENKVKCKGKGVYASLFGVGAPEALVIGVVALLVFGPKGLAEVARNLGKTLRAFQPTIRELQEVSRDFKSTLEREIGLDDIDSPVPKPSSSTTPKPTPEDSVSAAEPNGSPTEVAEKTTQDYLQVSEARLKGALAQLQKEQDEEREREEKEKEEKEKAELQQESSTAAQGAIEAQDTIPQETASKVTPRDQIPDSKPLQEVSSVASPASTPVSTLENES